MPATEGQSSTPIPDEEDLLPSNVIPARPAWFKVRTKQPDPEAKWSVLWLTDRDVLVCLVLGAVLLVLLAADWGRRSSWGRREIRIERSAGTDYVYRIDLNAANWVEFAQLDGIGPALAQRIVEDRERRGRFRTVDELDRVKGIGSKTLERLRPFVRVEVVPGRRLGHGL